MKTDTKSRRLCIFSLFLLFAAHWIFNLLMYSEDSSDPMLYAGFVYLFVFYVLCLLDVPLAVPGLWAVFGCAALCVGHFVTQFDNETFHLMPLNVLCVFLFLITQLAVQNQKYETSFFAVCFFFSCLLPLAQFGVIAYLFFNLKYSAGQLPKNDAFYSIVVLLLLAAVYARIPFSAQRPQKMESTRFKQLRTSFLLAAVSILESLVISRLSMSISLLRFVPLLWVLNLIFLNAAGSPFVCAFTAKCKRAQSRFLRGNAQEDT